MIVKIQTYYCDGKHYAELVGPDGEVLFSTSVGRREEDAARTDARRIAKKNGHKLAEGES